MAKQKGPGLTIVPDQGPKVVVFARPDGTPGIRRLPPQNYPTGPQTTPRLIETRLGFAETATKVRGQKWTSGPYPPGSQAVEKEMPRLAQRFRFPKRSEAKEETERSLWSLIPEPDRSALLEMVGATKSKKVAGLTVGPNASEYFRGLPFRVPPLTPTLPPSLAEPRPRFAPRQVARILSTLATVE